MTLKTDFNIDEMTVEVTIQPRERRWIPPKYHESGYRSPGRYSCSLADLTKKPRMYVWLKDESILDNLENRRRRPHALYRAFIPKILDALNVPEAKREGIRFNWSQRAGCSCPCSPGFVVTGMPSDGTYFDISVTISGVVPVELVADASKPKMIINDPTLPFKSEEA